MGCTVPPNLRQVRVLAAVDKFKGTATAAQVAAAIGSCLLGARPRLRRAARRRRRRGHARGARRAEPHVSTVTGPLGDPVQAEWRLHRGTAVIEMARASGLTLVGGAESNDAMAAIDHRHRRTDRPGARRWARRRSSSASAARPPPTAGYGCVRAITAPHRLRRVQLLVACDVQHAVRRRRRRVRAAEGCLAGAGRHAARPAAAIGADVPGAVRRRRARHPRHGCGRRTRRWPRGAGWAAAARVRPRRRRDSTCTTTSSPPTW